MKTEETLEETRCQERHNKIVYVLTKTDFHEGTIHEYNLEHDIEDIRGELEELLKEEYIPLPVFEHYCRECGKNTKWQASFNDTKCLECDKE